MSAKLEISTERTPADLRSWARSCGNGRAAARAYAIANALEGMTRAEAARLAGMERQALRDAVIRYNAEGVAGLFDRPKGHRREWLTQAEQAILADTVYRGPRPEINGVCTWTCEALAIWISERFGKTIHPDSVGRLLRRMGLSRQKARSVHPKKDPKAQEHFQKRGLRNALKTAAEAHPGKQSACSSRMRRASARRVGCVTGGGRRASARRACATSASTGPICSLPPIPFPARPSRWSCRPFQSRS